MAEIVLVSKTNWIAMEILYDYYCARFWELVLKDFPVQVKEVYVDTVGPPEKYQVRLYTVYSENCKYFPLFYIKYSWLTRTKPFCQFDYPKC